MTRNSIYFTTRCKHRSEPSSPQPDEIRNELLEELRQLRAALAVYRKLVDRLMEESRAA